MCQPTHPLTAAAFGRQVNYLSKVSLGGTVLIEAEVRCAAIKRKLNCCKLPA